MARLLVYDAYENKVYTLSLIHISRFPGHGHVVAVIGKKVEFGKPSLLLCRPYIRLYFCLLYTSRCV